MAGILWAMSLSLLVQAFLGTAGQTDRGCLKWSLHANGRDVCCDICHPGNHLQEDCGPNPRELCIPCEAKTFTVNPKAQSCSPCTECVGAQVLVKECTATHDTVCECKEGLVCGDATCSFCVKKCGKGEEPTETRSCTPCPNGTFNDQIHQKCKPWSKTCPPYKVVGEGTALTDITCVDTGTEKVKLHRGQTDMVQLLVIAVLLSTVLVVFSIIIIVVTWKIHRRKKIKTITKTPIIRTPTDDPRTLIAIECSFHEAEQEQGSSSESLFSNDSTKKLTG